MQLTNDLAALILNPAARLEIRVPMRWTTRDSSVRAEMSVHNAHGQPVILGVYVMIYKPWKLTAYLMVDNQQLRRLDLHGSHVNRTSDGESWLRRTHKHTFSEQHGTAVAYTPSDIPETPTADVTSEHYRGVFEAFCTEQAIQLTGEYRWVDPPLPADR